MTTTWPATFSAWTIRRRRPLRANFPRRADKRGIGGGLVGYVGSATFVEARSLEDKTITCKECSRPLFSRRATNSFTRKKDFRTSPSAARSAATFVKAKGPAFRPAALGPASSRLRRMRNHDHRAVSSPRRQARVLPRLLHSARTRSRLKRTPFREPVKSRVWSAAFCLSSPKSACDE